ncbi:hypothetical protein [Sphingobium sp. RAC03]|uniref:hypothetical protein n=1 Tax=Sphingobium sp. RAC03 TaxID=1843368 RepID=UPI0014956484|nr:hypothetical protein [Sphingobium sp. RAC03]
MTLAASVAMGLGLGSYVTSPQKTAVSAEEWSPDDDNSYVEAGRTASMFGDSGTSDRGPAVIRCTGCGPTLTERRFAADMAGIEGSSDPYVQDYVAQDYPVTDDSLVHDAASEKPVSNPRLDRSKVAVADPMVKPVAISPGGVVQPIIVPTIDHNHP